MSGSGRVEVVDVVILVAFCDNDLGLEVWSFFCAVKEMTEKSDAIIFCNTSRRDERLYQFRYLESVVEYNSCTAGAQRSVAGFCCSDCGTSSDFNGC